MGLQALGEQFMVAHGHILWLAIVILPKRHSGSLRPTTLGVTMTGASTEGIKTVLHPVSDLAKAKAVYSALLGVAPSPTRRTTWASTPPVSTSGWCRVVGRRA